MEKRRENVKRILVFFIVLLVLGVFLAAVVFPTLKTESPDLVDKTPTPTLVPSEAAPLKNVVTLNNEKFAYAFFPVTDPNTLVLVPNFTKPKDAETIKDEYVCASVINGGFYDKSNKPLGYFYANEKTVGPRIESELVNGFVWGASGSAVISSELPRTPIDFALQTGPMLLFDGKVLPLAINNDAPARRMVAAKNDELIFIAVYSPESVFSGPLLGDLPEIVKLISDKEKLSVSEAINLDGGSASAFYSGETSLSELTPVGSVFCDKQM